MLFGGFTYTYIYIYIQIYIYTHTHHLVIKRGNGTSNVNGGLLGTWAYQHFAYQLMVIDGRLILVPNLLYQWPLDQTTPIFRTNVWENTEAQQHSRPISQSLTKLRKTFCHGDLPMAWWRLDFVGWLVFHVPFGGVNSCWKGCERSSAHNWYVIHT